MKKYLFVLLLILCTAGCANPDNSEHDKTSSRAPIGTKLSNGAVLRVDDNGKRYWEIPEKTEEEYQQSLIEKWHIKDASSVRPAKELFVKYVSEDDHEFLDCMAEAGFPYTPHEDGSWSKMVEPDQVEADAIASYICDAQFPRDPSSIPKPWNESDAEEVYEWQTGPALKCFEEHGVSVPEPPSKEEFVDDYFDNMGMEGWLLQKYSPKSSFSDEVCPVLPPRFDQR